MNRSSLQHRADGLPMNRVAVDVRRAELWGWRRESPCVDSYNNMEVQVADAGFGIVTAVHEPGPRSRPAKRDQTAEFVPSDLIRRFTTAAT